MSGPPSQVFRDPPLTSFTGWDNVNIVRQALLELEQGQCYTAAQLVDAMGRDDRIEGVCNARINGLMGLPLEMAGQGDGRKAASVADAAKEVWPECFPVSAIEELWRWGRFLGVGVAELVWDLETWNPKLKVWHPRFLAWRWDTRSYWVNTMDGQVEVTPGDGKWVLYAPHGVERGWFRGMVRSLSIPWLIRQWGLRDWSRYSEVHGLPIRQVITPQSASKDDKKRALDEIAKLASESVVITPQGTDGNKFDVKLIEAVANTWQGFEKLLDKAESCIAINVLGQNLTTEVKGGSFAAADVHDRVRGDFLKADAETLAQCLRDQALKPWALYQYGDANLAPKPCWQVEPPEDLGSKATVFKTAAEGLVAARAAGAPIDAEAVVEGFGLPVGTPQEPLPVAAPAVGAPPAEKPPPAKASRVELDKLDHTAEGQVYADELADNVREQAAELLAPDLRKLLDLVEEGKDYEGIRQALVKAYGKMKPAKLAELTRKALILANLNGQLTAAKGT